MLKDLKLAGFIKEVSSSSPAPGGGTVSALSGACGAALLEMAVQVSEKNLTSEQRGHYLSKLSYFREQCTTLLDEDTKAFSMVMEAYRLPKKNDEEKKLRQARIQEALHVASETPLKTAECCLALMKLAEEIIALSKESCVSDAACGYYCSEAGLRGALSNVAINLSHLSDEQFRNVMKEKIDALTNWHRINSPKIEKLIRERLSI